MKRSSLRWTIPTFLALQLGLLWIQGAQLHRQNQVLQGLREDLQALAESLDNGQSQSSQEDDSSSVPAGRRWSQGGTPQKAAVLGVGEDQEPAAKDLRAARESAQKAVKEARVAQTKVSIEANGRKAGEAKQVPSTTTGWQGWGWGAVALAAALALVARSVIRRRA